MRLFFILALVSLVALPVAAKEMKGTTVPSAPKDGLNLSAGSKSLDDGASRIERENFINTEQRRGYGKETKPRILPHERIQKY